ncbi:hypothetical protein HYV31_02745 [candidate division WWE3 bacterium]|nr:hypothetical protein [candidate division WWE3 bacterium]
MPNNKNAQNEEDVDETLNETVEKEPPEHREARKEMLDALAEAADIKQMPWESKENLAWLLAGYIQSKPDLADKDRIDFILTKPEGERLLYKDAWKSFQEKIDQIDPSVIKEKIMALEKNRDLYMQLERGIQKRQSQIEVAISGRYTQEELEDAKQLGEILLKAIIKTRPTKPGDALDGNFIGMEINRASLKNNRLVAISSKVGNMRPGDRPHEIILPENLHISRNDKAMEIGDRTLRLGDTINIPVFERPIDNKTPAKTKGWISIKLGISNKEAEAIRQSFIYRKKGEEGNKPGVESPVEKGNSKLKAAEENEELPVNIVVKQYSGTNIEQEEKNILKVDGRIPLSVRGNAGTYTILKLETYETETVFKSAEEREARIDSVAKELAKNIAENTGDLPLEIILRQIPRLCRTIPDMDNGDISPRTQKYLRELAPRLENALRLKYTGTVRPK